MPREITAFSNPTVKRLRSLRDKKARKEEGLFLAEGLRIIAEARDSGQLPEILMLSPEGARHPLAAEISAATEAAGGDVIQTTPDILSKTSGKDNPQMLVAAYRQPGTGLAAIDRGKAPLWFVAQALRDKKARRSEGLFLAEGLRIIAEARDSGQLPEIIAYSPAGGVHPLAAEIIAAAEAKGADIIETTADILSKMSGKDNPQAILGAYRQPDTSLAAIDRSASPLCSVAQGLSDPGNIGTILRTGDATAAGGLILIDDSADPYSVEAVRASMGAIFTQQVAKASWDEFHDWLRGGAGQLVGTSLKAPHDYLEVEYQPPCFLLIGNEQQGLPPAYEKACDVLVKIPMAGRADSLNAAVAAAVMAFQVKASWRSE